MLGNMARGKGGWRNRRKTSVSEVGAWRGRQGGGPGSRASRCQQAGVQAGFHSQCGRSATTHFCF